MSFVPNHMHTQSVITVYRKDDGHEFLIPVDSLDEFLENGFTRDAPKVAKKVTPPPAEKPKASKITKKIIEKD